MTKSPEESALLQRQQSVDESGIRRTSIMSGLWNGMRWGALAGGATLAAMTGVGTLVGVAAASKLVNLPFAAGSAVGGGLPGLIVGGITAVLGWGAGLVGLNAAGGAITLGGAAMFGLAVVGVAAAVGAVIGAVNGYLKSGNEIDSAHESAQLAKDHREIEKKMKLQHERKMAIAESRLRLAQEDLHVGGGHGLPPAAPQGKQGGRGTGSFPNS